MVERLRSVEGAEEIPLYQELLRDLDDDERNALQRVLDSIYDSSKDPSDLLEVVESYIDEEDSNVASFLINLEKAIKADLPELEEYDEQGRHELFLVASLTFITWINSPETLSEFLVLAIIFLFFTYIFNGIAYAEGIETGASMERRKAYLKQVHTDLKDAYNQAIGLE